MERVLYRYGIIITSIVMNQLFLECYLFSCHSGKIISVLTGSKYIAIKDEQLKIIESPKF